MAASLLAAYRSFQPRPPQPVPPEHQRHSRQGGSPDGLEDWAGEPFLLATGDSHRAQALWSFAHGMVILEIDGRFPEHSDLDRTWRAGAAAFAPR